MLEPAHIRLHRERDLYRGAFTAMANPCEVLCETSDESVALAITHIAAREALRIERKFSRYRDDSVVHAINTASGREIVLDEETSQLVDYATALWEGSDRAFDITSGVFRHAWKFGATASAPTVDEIAALLARIGWHRVTWRRPSLTMPAGMELDFGGIGKEYAVDRAVALVEECFEVPVLINFGGDLRTAGGSPKKAWRVGIESITATGRTSNLIELATGALATSGDTRRFIEIDGRRYGHIIDARTGWPAPNTPRSITVAADTCSQAGSFTTLAMLKGANAEQFLIEEGVQYWCLR